MAIELDTPWGHATLPQLTCRLPGGLTGYFQRDMDSCHRACIATVLQVTYEEVPDTHTPGWHERVDNRQRRPVRRVPWPERSLTFGAVPDLQERHQAVVFGSWPAAARKS